MKLGSEQSQWPIVSEKRDHPPVETANTKTLKRFNTRKAISGHLEDERKKGHTIGFVPTMGALHEGHLQLIRTAREECETLVSSIFVNPEQFDDPNDLAQYPRTLEEDLGILQKEGCDVVYTPPEEEVYLDKEKPSVALEGLDKVLEGAQRPGHFTGVMMVVERLFRTIQPDKAYFGKKDYQQLKIIEKLVEQLALPIRIIPCPIVREKDGLAMSSRNRRLSPDQRDSARSLYQTLRLIRERASEYPPSSLKEMGLEKLRNTSEVKPEYFEIADKESLEPRSDENGTDDAIALVAARVGDVRLIDNIELDR